MGQVIPRQHPAVVLKSSFNAVRALLAVALIAVAALAATVVVLAADTDTTVSVAPKSAQALPSGPAAGTPESVQRQTLPAGTRFDGGPDEGTRGPQSYSQLVSHAGGPQPVIPIGPGGR